MRNHLFRVVTFAALAVSGFMCATDAASADNAWTGFYVGAGVGFRTSQADVKTKAFIDALGNSNPATGSVSFNGTSSRVSPYVGFNWQIDPQWVVGLEGDYGFAENTGSQVGDGFTPIPSVGQKFSGDSLVVRTAWDAGLHARAGYLFTPSILGYVTGGAAWQQVDVISTCSSESTFRGTGDCSLNGVHNGTGSDIGPPVIKSSVTQTGWTIGGGVETMLWDNWLARAEYRYADFGSSPFSTVRTSPLGFTAGTLASVAVQTHTVTFSIAYLFN